MKNNGLAMILWMIWAAMFLAAFIYQAILGGGIPSGEDGEGLEWMFVWLCFACFAASTALRWLLIPKVKRFEKVFPIMVAGLAFAEAPQFFQIFLIGPDYPATQLSIFILAVLTLLQWVPTFAKNMEA